MTHDSYFMILVEVFLNHILAENTHFTKSEQNTRLWSSNLQISTESFSNVIILKTFLSTTSSKIHGPKVLQTSFFTEPKMTN